MLSLTSLVNKAAVKAGTSFPDIEKINLPIYQPLIRCMT